MNLLWSPIFTVCYSIPFAVCGVYTPVFVPLSIMGGLILASEVRCLINQNPMPATQPSDSFTQEIEPSMYDLPKLRRKLQQAGKIKVLKTGTFTTRIGT